MPHFAWLPPEINSALIFAGPGAAPLLAAAAAWDELAEDLASSASSFFSVTSDLVNGSWQGASATAMMAVASQYVSWLSAAAAQAEVASSQASAIAAAFEAALAATVQPAVVAANRGLAQVLAATNWLGQNAPAIADIEAAYEQMWASDVAAMFGYHAGATAAAEQLAPWQQVLQGLGFHFNKGQITFGPLATTQSSSNVGAGNTGSQNVGAGNTGSNIGFGNVGSGNTGFGNTGNNDFGIGLTGNNEFGFFGFNLGSGNIGTGNIGSFSAATANTGLATQGSSAEAGMLNSGRYVTGGLSAANLSSGLLNSATAATGFNPGVTNPGLLNPALANAAFANPADPGIIAASLESNSANGGVVSAVSGPTPTPPALRTTTTGPSGVFASGGNDSGFRNPATPDPGISSSAFFTKGDGSTAGPGSGTEEPGLPG
ncbi:MAG TPA: PPE family protein [Mycobacterium sp.]|nr:PPE family protein [Mycobacterium sp.]HUH68046.1 PPE family protein [Mycobacterium sp.]